MLRDWWQHGELAAAGPKVEDSLEKFYQLSQYLGERKLWCPVHSKGREPSLLIVAEIRKPGLKKFLQQMVNELAGKSKPGVRAYWTRRNSQVQRTGARRRNLVLLVRPDFVVAGAQSGHAPPFLMPGWTRVKPWVCFYSIWAAGCTGV